MDKKIALLTDDEIFARYRESPASSSRGYYAMYSSWLGGITRNPNLMSVPIDDHIVHRGDGVFEAAKCVDRRLYAFDRHLDRLALSAGKIGLTLPHSLEKIREIAVETLTVANVDQAMLRLYISRGPGSFTANPYESIASQMYLVITPYRPLAASRYETGVSAGLSQIEIKEGFFSQVKSCNYLPNVLMKKESVDRGLDFTVSRDREGFLAESSTENFAIVTRAGELAVPEFSNTLRGITAVRILELAQSLVGEGKLTKAGTRRVHIDEVSTATECMMLGTTLDCLPVTKFEGKGIGTGAVGPIAKALQSILRVDMDTGPLVLRI